MDRAAVLVSPANSCLCNCLILGLKAHTSCFNQETNSSVAFPVPKPDALGIWSTSPYMAIPALAPSSVYSVNSVPLLTLEYPLSAGAVVSFLHLCSPALSKDRGGLSHI